MEQHVFKYLGFAYNSKQSNECKKGEQDRLRLYLQRNFRKRDTYSYKGDTRTKFSDWEEEIYDDTRIFRKEIDNGTHRCPTTTKTWNKCPLRLRSL